MLRSVTVSMDDSHGVLCRMEVTSGESRCTKGAVARVTTCIMYNDDHDKVSVGHRMMLLMSRRWQKQTLEHCALS